MSPFAWQSNKAILFYFTQNSVSEVGISTGAQRSSFRHHHLDLFICPKPTSAVFLVCPLPEEGVRNNNGAKTSLRVLAHFGGFPNHCSWGCPAAVPLSRWCRQLGSSSTELSAGKVWSLLNFFLSCRVWRLGGISAKPSLFPMEHRKVGTNIKVWRVIIFRVRIINRHFHSSFTVGSGPQLPAWVPVPAVPETNNSHSPVVFELQIVHCSLSWLCLQRWRIRPSSANPQNRVLDLVVNTTSAATSNVILGKLLNFSKSQFLFCKMKLTTVPTL